LIRGAAFLLAGLLLAGCAGRSPLVPLALPGTIELTRTPFFPQADFQCGPAALATVLGEAGVPTSPDALVPEVYLPDRQGSLQVELRAAVRRRGQMPVAVRGDLGALSAALRAGSPVLVLQNLGLQRWPVWHYAVVIGLDPEADEVILRSGTTYRERMEAARFRASWGGWGFTVHSPEAPPAWASAADWLETVAVWARLGQHEAAWRATTAAIDRWPDRADVWLAHGNAAYASGERQMAARAFESAVALQPTAGGYNNLAHVLGELGCHEAALAALASARPLGGDANMIDATAAMLQSMPSAPCER
jgi:tetratricopeptide (TPR) repeat protein